MELQKNFLRELHRRCLTARKGRGEGFIVAGTPKWRPVGDQDAWRIGDSPDICLPASSAFERVTTQTF